jgi:hypothetical protein
MIVLNIRRELAAAALSRRSMFAVVTVLARPRGQPTLNCWLRDYGEAPLQGARNDAVPKPLAALADQIAAPNLRSGLALFLMHRATELQRLIDSMPGR